MQAQVIAEFGEPDVFQTRDVPRPVIRPGHVLIRVAASSVNPLDCRIRRYGLPFGPALPAILHGDILRQIAQIVDAGHLRPLLDERVFAFEDVAAAHQRAESGQQIGKVVLLRE